MAFDEMTTHVPRAVLIGNGSRGPFTLNDSSGNAIRVRTHSHLVVRRYSSVTDETGTALALNTDYTVSNTDVDVVTITLTSAQAVLASTERLVVTRLQSLADVISLSTGGNFSAETLSAAMSVLTEQLQEVRRDVDRSIKPSWRNTVTPSLPIAPSATKLLGHTSDDALAHVEVATISPTGITLGSGWPTVLGLDAASTLDNLSGVRFCATYAAMTALTNATGLADGGIYYTVSRTNVLDMNDGSAGEWVFKLGATTTTNGGTILADDANTGRFYRKHGGRVNAGCFGAVGDGVTSITAALNLWILAIQNSSNDAPAPRSLYFGVGSWVALTKPNKMEDLGYVEIACSGLQTVFRMGFTCTNETEALFHAYGSTVLNLSKCAIGTLAGGSKGGSLVRLEAKSSSAPDFSQIEGVYFTSYGSASAKLVETATTANPAVFGVTAHGYSNGDEVVLLYGSGGTWSSQSHQFCTISDVTTDSFTLTVVATGTKIDGSGLGTYSANTATVKKGLCSDYPISIDGSARTTGAVGVRGVVISNCQIFGGRKGVVLANGVVGLPMPGTIWSDAGWNGAIRGTGTASVPNYYININGASVARVELDRCFYTTVTAQVQGDVIQTANTFGTQITGPVGGRITRLGTKNSGPGYLTLTGGISDWDGTATGLTGVASTKSFGVTFAVAPKVWADHKDSVITNVTTTGYDIANATVSSDLVHARGELSV